MFNQDVKERVGALELAPPHGAVGRLYTRFLKNRIVCVQNTTLPLTQVIQTIGLATIFKKMMATTGLLQAPDGIWRSRRREISCPAMVANGHSVVSQAFGSDRRFQSGRNHSHASLSARAARRCRPLGANDLAVMVATGGIGEHFALAFVEMVEGDGVTVRLPRRGRRKVAVVAGDVGNADAANRTAEKSADLEIVVRINVYCFRQR